MLPPMAEPLRVSIADIRSALDRALDAAESLLGTEVTIPSDYYWNMPVEAAFNMHNEPATFTVGQVSDDVATLREPTSRVPEVAWHDLSHLIGVLRAVEFAARS